MIERLAVDFVIVAIIFVLISWCVNRTPDSGNRKDYYKLTRR